MKIASLLFFESAAGILGAAGFVHGLPEIGIAGLVVGGLGLLAFAVFRPAFVHAMLGFYAVVAGVTGLFHLPPLLCASAVAAALIGWDAGLTAPRVSRASTGVRRRFALAYALRALPVAFLGVLLVAAAGRIHVPLTFGTGLGLSFAALALAALFLRALRRSETTSGDPRPDRK